MERFPCTLIDIYIKDPAGLFFPFKDLWPWICCYCSFRARKKRHWRMKSLPVPFRDSAWTSSTGCCVFRAQRDQHCWWSHQASLIIHWSPETTGRKKYMYVVPSKIWVQRTAKIEKNIKSRSSMDGQVKNSLGFIYTHISTLNKSVQNGLPAMFLTGYLVFSSSWTCRFL